MEPNDVVLGCMLDALVSHGDVEEAISLLEEWKPKVPPNTPMYSAIMQGLANTQQTARALETWKELCESGLPLSVVAYNAVIDSQARVGDMDRVSKLVESMG